VNTDNGSEFLKNFEQACNKMNIQHFFTYPRTPKMNPLAERFNRTIQEEAELPLVENSLQAWNRFCGSLHHALQFLSSSLLSQLSHSG